MSKKSYLVNIQPYNKTIKSFDDESLLQSLKRENYHLKSSCGGLGTCSDCVVKVIKDSKSMNEINFNEKKVLGNVYHITKERLSCQLKVLDSGLEVDISEHEINIKNINDLQANASKAVNLPSSKDIKKTKLYKKNERFKKNEQVNEESIDSNQINKQNKELGFRRVKSYKINKNKKG
jgi:ferredoxin, 2Fe-2S